jgi:lysophospholipase
MKEYQISIKDFFKGYDNNKIRYGVFGEKNYSKIIVILQGRAEYFEKYKHIADHFIEKGYLAVLMDWRGQGGSVRELEDKDKGHINDFAQYQKDFKFFLKIVSKFIKPGVKVFAAAHSMGGHNILRYLIENKNTFFSKVLFSSPMLGIRTYPLPEEWAKYVAKFFVKSGFGSSYVINTGKYKEIEFKNNPLTSDLEKFYENIYFLRKKRDFAIGGPTYSWVYNAYLSMDYIKKNIDKINKNVKTKIIFGSNDKVVTKLPLKKLSKFMTEPFVEIKNGKHELMMENPEILNKFFHEADMFFGTD